LRKIAELEILLVCGECNKQASEFILAMGLNFPGNF